MQATRRRAALLGFVLLCGACASYAPMRPATDTTTPQAAVDDLLAADRAFSAASARTDLVAGLSAMFAADVAVPIPGSRFSASASEAVAALSANPDYAGARAEWTPVRGGISADGLQGYTWGYMTIRGADGTSTPAKYLSYWIKGPSGWRVAAYRWRPRAAGAVSLVPRPPSVPPRLVAPSGDAAATEAFRASLDAAERAFSADAQIVGLGVAFARYGTSDAVNMGGRNNAEFIVGSEAIGRFVSDGKPTQPSPVTWWPDRTIVASSGDLGVTIGLIRDNATAGTANAQVYPFFTVWRRESPDARWRYIAE